jgi:hypothetical protein
MHRECWPFRWTGGSLDDCSSAPGSGKDFCLCRNVQTGCSVCVRSYRKLVQIAAFPGIKSEQLEAKNSVHLEEKACISVPWLSRNFSHLCFEDRDSFTSFSLSREQFYYKRRKRYCDGLGVEFKKEKLEHNRNGRWTFISETLTESLARGAEEIFRARADNPMDLASTTIGSLLYGPYISKYLNCHENTWW